MKKFSKALAIICAVALVVCAIVIPTSASTVTMPKKTVIVDDFEGGVDYWRSQETSSVGAIDVTYETSADYSYGDSGKSMKAVLTHKWDGVKTYGKRATVQYTGISAWMYIPEALGVKLIVKVVLKTETNTTANNFEVLVDTTQGENIILVPWVDFVDKTNNCDTNFESDGVYIDQIYFLLDSAPSTAKTVYIDNVGVYRDDSAPVEFIPSTVSKPENFETIDNFDTAGSFGWEAYNSTVEYSNERGFGTSGRSLHVFRDSSNAWAGTKTSSGHSLNCQLKGDGIAFWAKNNGASINDFVVVLNQNGVRYEEKIQLVSGEAFYTINYDKFEKNTNGTITVIDRTKQIKQIEFIKSATTFDFYIDELGFYGVEPECTHENTTTTNTATYFNDGVETVYCEDCKTTISETPVSAIKTAPVIFDDAILEPETNKLTVAWTYSEALNEDIKAAATKGLAVKFAFGDKEYTVPNTVLNTEGGSVTIEGINADRFNKELTVKLEFAIGDYNTEVLNGAAIYTVAVNTTVDSENVKANAYNGLINAISNATEAVVEGAGTGSDDFTAEDSSVDIKAGTATFKFVATKEFFDTVKANGTDNRTVKLVVTVDGEEHEVTINQLKTSIKVTIKGLSFEQMYGSVSAKLVITYSDDSSKNIDSKAVSFNFADGIDASENTVAVALEALLKN